MSVKDSMKTHLAATLAAATLVTSPGAFSADDEVNADLASHNRTEITQQIEDPGKPRGHLPLPEERYRNKIVPIYGAVAGEDGITPVPITLPYYHAAMHDKLNNGPVEIVLTTIRGEGIPSVYPRAIAQMAQNVSAAYKDDRAVVTAVINAYPGEKTERGGGEEGSIAGGIGIYVNDRGPIYVYPKSTSKDDLIENIREAQTQLIYDIEQGFHLLSAEQYKAALKERTTEQRGLATSNSGDVGGDSGSGSATGAAEQDSTPMAS